MRARFSLRLLVLIGTGLSGAFCTRAAPTPPAPVPVRAPVFSTAPHACEQAPTADSARAATHLADSARAYLSSANAQTASGHASTAAELFTAAANLNPCDEWIYVDGARAFDLAAAREYSLTMLRHGLLFLPGSGQLWYELAERFHELGRSADACAAVRRFRSGTNQRVARACAPACKELFAWAATCPSTDGVNSAIVAPAV
jgi:hypothetical protein